MSSSGAAPAPSLSGRRRLTQGELDIIIDLHERIVTGRPGGRRASLRFFDFSGLDLAGRNLCDADLSASVFDGCKMAGAQLERANLFGSDLRKADLRGAKLVRADLRGACLRGANLTNADLTGADFREGQVSIPHPKKGLDLVRHEKRPGLIDQAILVGATLDDSQFSGASAFATDFTDCSLRGANLKGANLKDANLTGANLQNAEVGGANLEGANFEDAVLTGVDVSRAKTHGAKLSGALADPSAAAVARAPMLLEMAKANQAWCRTGGKEGAPARFDGADLRVLGDQLKGMRLTAASLKGACLIGMDLSGVQLQGSNLEGADMRGVLFQGADLRGARFACSNLTKADLRQGQVDSLPLGPGRSTPASFLGARMRYAQLQSADFTDAVFDQADLRSADFTGSKVTGASFNRAEISTVVGLELDIFAD